MAGPASPALRASADAVRRAAVGDVVHVRALLEFSSRCRQNCLYCGLRRDNTSLERYALDPEAVVAAAIAAARAGYGSIVLQSGEDPSYTRAVLARIVGRIKDEAPGLLVTLSVGERSRSDYLAWRRAGADRYLIKHETADADLYARLRPGHRLAARLRRAEVLRELGYKVGLGNMVGLPGETDDALEADLELIRAFRPDMIATGPFIPHPKTPLAGAPPGDPDRALDFLARARLALPGALIPATTALATARAGGREAALASGANVVMINIGEAALRARYEIYPSRDLGPAAASELSAAGPRQAAPSPAANYPARPSGAGSYADPPSVSRLAAQRRTVVAWLAGLGRRADGSGQAADGSG